MNLFNFFFFSLPFASYFIFIVIQKISRLSISLITLLFIVFFFFLLHSKPIFCTILPCISMIYILVFSLFVQKENLANVKFSDFAGKLGISLARYDFNYFYRSLHTIIKHNILDTLIATCISKISEPGHFTMLK